MDSKEPEKVELPESMQKEDIVNNVAEVKHLTPVISEPEIKEKKPRKYQKKNKRKDVDFLPTRFKTRSQMKKEEELSSSETDSDSDYQYPYITKKNKNKQSPSTTERTAKKSGRKSKKIEEYSDDDSDSEYGVISKKRSTRRSKKANYEEKEDVAATESKEDEKRENEKEEKIEATKTEEIKEEKHKNESEEAKNKTRKIKKEVKEKRNKKEEPKNETEEEDKSDLRIINGKPTCSRFLRIKRLPKAIREENFKRFDDQKKFNHIKKIDLEYIKENNQFTHILKESSKGKDSQLVSSILESQELNYMPFLKFDKSDIEGWGVRTTVKIPKGKKVIEYIGEIIRPIIADKRQDFYEHHGNSGTYVFKLSNTEYLDATNRGGLARFINHSCDPNCESTIGKLGNRVAVILKAKRDISPFEELSYDYNLPFESKAKAIRCNCGAKNCRKYLNYTEDLFDDETMKKVVLKNIPESVLLKLIHDGVLSLSLFAADAEYYEKSTKENKQ